MGWTTNLNWLAGFLNHQPYLRILGKRTLFFWSKRVQPSSVVGGFGAPWPIILSMLRWSHDDNNWDDFPCFTLHSSTRSYENVCKNDWMRFFSQVEVGVFFFFGGGGGNFKGGSSEDPLHPPGSPQNVVSRGAFVGHWSVSAGSVE